MKKQTQNASRGRVFLSKCKNRPYLAACPVQILSSEFFLDLKLQKKVMKLRIRNSADRAVTGMTLLVRYLDRDGAVMGDETGYIVLKFTSIYCAPGKTALGSKTVILPYQDISGIEACVTAVIFEDGTEQTFPAEDYILAPEQDMLENHVSPADFAVLRRAFGEECFFVPQKAGKDQWLCACGAAADVHTDTVCPACGMKRADALRLSADASRRGVIRSLRLRRTVLRSIPYVIGLSLIAWGAMSLRSIAAEHVNVTLPERRLEYTRRYMEEHRYAEALGYSVTKNQSLLYDEILDHAVAYYCGIGDYAAALQYEQCRSVPDYEPIYTHAAEAMQNGSADAAQYALMTADESLKNALLSRMATEKFDAGDSAAACALALHMTGTDGARFADSLLYETLSQLLENGQYESAVTYINCLTDKSGVADLCRGIELELLSQGKFEEAFTVASLTGDTNVFAMAYHSATASTMRAYIDKFFPYMSTDEKRAFLADTLSAGANSVTAIHTSGAAVDSVLGTLCQDALAVSTGDAHVLVLQNDGTARAFGENGQGQCGEEDKPITGAIAVAAGGQHSVVLLEDGTVRAFGDNSAGQCDVSDWKNVIAVTAGARHTAALLSDGTLVAAGSNESGQCAVTGYTDVVAVEAGDYATAMIFRDGTVAVEGNITLETYDCRSWEEVVEIRVGNAHMIGLTVSGRVLFAGDPDYEGADDVDSWTRVRTVACGKTTSYGVTAAGKLMSGDPNAVLPDSDGWEVLKG